MNSVSETSGVFNIVNGVLRQYTGIDADIFIPDRTSRIGDAVFMGSTDIRSVAVPAGTEAIGKRCFSGCTSLIEISLPDSLRSIGEYAFDGCRHLREIRIPDGVTRIEPYTFRNCTSLRKVVIPDSITSIGLDAFINCSDLNSIYIPASVTEIRTVFDRHPFIGCSHLTINSPEGSAANEFAVRNNIPHICIGNAAGNRSFSEAKKDPAEVRRRAVDLFNNGTTTSIRSAIDLLLSIHPYNDSGELLDEFNAVLQKEIRYTDALKHMESGNGKDLRYAKNLFSYLGDYKDSAIWLEKCERRLENHENDAEPGSAFSFTAPALPERKDTVRTEQKYAVTESDAPAPSAKNEGRSNSTADSLPDANDLAEILAADINRAAQRKAAEGKNRNIERDTAEPAVRYAKKADLIFDGQKSERPVDKQIPAAEKHADADSGHRSGTEGIRRPDAGQAEAFITRSGVEASPEKPLVENASAAGNRWAERGEVARKRRAEREEAARKRRAEKEEAARKRKADKEEAARKRKADKEEAARKRKAEMEAAEEQRRLEREETKELRRLENEAAAERLRAEKKEAEERRRLKKEKAAEKRKSGYGKAKSKGKKRTGRIILFLLLIAVLAAAAYLERDRISSLIGTKEKPEIQTEEQTDDYVLTLEDFVNNNQKASDQIHKSVSGTNVKVSVSENTLIYTYDISSNEGLTAETAQSDEIINALVETLDSSDDRFIELCSSLEYDTGIDGISVEVRYQYEDQSLIKRRYTSEGVQ